MPSYYYHLKFELYPNADPTTTTTKASGGGKKSALNEQVWLPTDGASIFDDLPSHPRRARANNSNSSSSSSAWVSSGPLERRDKFPERAPAVIDCGTPRGGGTSQEEEDGAGDDHRNIVHLTERQWRARSKSFPPPGFAAGIGPRTAAKDWRFGRVNIESFDMAGASAGAGAGAGGTHHDQGGGSSSSGGYFHVPVDGEHVTPAASLGPNLGGPGQATKARYVPLETKNTEVGWGVVHLYRENDESHALRAEPWQGPDGAGSSSVASAEDDCTILCIPAVPSYLSPSDFLGFVGEKWRGDVSHYRMVMTSRMNRYMVLMKFRDNRRAREWRKEFDGKVFNSMEAEICHVTFIKSITVETPTQPKDTASSLNSDPFGPASAGGLVSSMKPFPPPTPSLIELPTCPVCLERMDDTTGLMTILCQHVFHCTCLQTWKGSGCPVCRATNPTPDSDPNNPYARPFGTDASNLCSVCDCTDDLWICLICGNVGCGRYKGGHAKDHWKETAHSFSLELETQHVWDYAGDMWVHRLIRDKGDGKVVELPSNANRVRDGGRGERGSEDEDVVPRAKLDNIGMEYSHLLTSQLESQRIYFEEMVSKAADKASKASAAAETAGAQAQEAVRELRALRAEHRALREETVPALERDVERERRRADKSTELARKLGQALQEEKKVSEGLLARVEHVNKEVEGVRRQMLELKAENEELKETNRDLTMFISGQEKLKELEEEGKIEEGELEAGTVSIPEERRRKGKGKAKK